MIVLLLGRKTIYIIITSPVLINKKDHIFKKSFPFLIEILFENVTFYHEKKKNIDLLAILNSILKRSLAFSVLNMRTVSELGYRLESRKYLVLTNFDLLLKNHNIIEYQITHNFVHTVLSYFPFLSYN